MLLVGWNDLIYSTVTGGGLLVAQTLTPTALLGLGFLLSSTREGFMDPLNVHYNLTLF